MSDALKATGKNILLNLCNWGEDLVHTVRHLFLHTKQSRGRWLIRTIVGNVHFELLAHDG